MDRGSDTACPSWMAMALAPGALQGERARRWDFPEREGCLLSPVLPRSSLTLAGQVSPGWVVQVPAAVRPQSCRLETWAAGNTGPLPAHEFTEPERKTAHPPRAPASCTPLIHSLIHSFPTHFSGACGLPWRNPSPTLCGSRSRKARPQPDAILV